MLEHVAHDDDVEALWIELGAEQLLGANVEAQAIPRVGGGEAAWLQPHARAPAAVACLSEQESDPAADVEDRPARRKALDPLQDAGEGRPLPRLLLDVVVGGSFGVGGVELDLGRETVELHMGADGAADDVAERGPELLGLVGMRPSAPMSPRTRIRGSRIAAPQAAHRSAALTPVSVGGAAALLMRRRG